MKSNCALYTCTCVLYLQLSIIFSLIFMNSNTQNNISIGSSGFKINTVLLIKINYNIE